MRTQTRSLAGLLTLTVLLLVGCNEHNPVEADQPTLVQESDALTSAAKKSTSPFTLENITVDVLDPITGDPVGTFTGTLEITRFFVRTVNGVEQLFAAGKLTGTIRDLEGNIIETVKNLKVELPIEGLSSGQTCEILFLDLGPIHLDLLGLVVDVSQIEIKITAESGPGNLLGNLLCAVAGLLDDGGPLQDIADLLNRIVDLLS